MNRSTLRELTWHVSTPTSDSELSANWKEIRRAAVPLAFRWMFRPVGYPNEAGLPESYSLLEVPASLLIACGVAAVLCLLAGIIGVWGWPFLIVGSFLIVLTLQFAMQRQIQIWQNADEHFRQSKASENCVPECD